MTRSHRLSFAALAALLAMLALPVTAGAVGIAQRTLRAALGINGTAPDGSSTHPFVSALGHVVAFDSTASDLALDPNGHVRDVFVRDLDANTVQLVSESYDGTGANGPSSAPVVTDDDRTVAFTSEASNLVRGDANGVADVFARYLDGPVERVSVTPAGTSADGPSAQPDISADGRYVAFTSSADDLVAHDQNQLPDVFVADRASGAIRRVSQPASGVDANGASSAPAISPDGRYVSFYSRATNLVAHDRNHLGDVFLADLRTGTIRLVSLGARGRQQNKSVIKPFEQVSDVSDQGRFVAFDSDATNLVKHDRNRATDVFVRDVRHKKTVLASVALPGGQGNNDSFYPRITPNGRWVAFDSFADNLYPGAARGPNVFVRDLQQHVTSDMSVTASGRKRGREHVAKQQLLQRPSLSDDGQVVGLTSTAALVRGDADRREDAYVRLAAPPSVRISLRGGVFRLIPDDPVAKVFPCIAGARVGFCPERAPLSKLPGGRYLLQARAMGMGTLVGEPAFKRIRR